MPLQAEQVGSGVRLTYRPTLWLENGIVCGFQIVGILFAGLVIFATVGAHDQQGSHGDTLVLAGCFTAILGFFWARRWFGVEVLTVDNCSLQRDYSLFGFSLSHGEYTNSKVLNLHYAAWSGGREGRQSEIRFDYETLPVRFARQVSASDAAEMIERMRAVYPFPEPTAGNADSLRE